MRIRWNNLIWLGILLGAALLVTGCGGHVPPGSHDRPAVKFVRPVTREVNDYAYYTGRVEAVQSVDIQARVTGYLDSIDYVPGTAVDAKQRLFKIDPRPYQAALDEANGQLKLAKARLQLAIADYKRALEVAKTPGAISQQDVDRYAAAEAEASAAVDAATANTESAKLNLEFTDVISPIDGNVSRNLLTKGNLVKQDTTLLTTVVSEDPIFAYFDVDDSTMLRFERLIAKGKVKTLEEGAVVPVELGLSDEGSDYPHVGKLDYVSNQLDPTTATLQVRGIFENPILRKGGPRLLAPGMFVRIRLSVGPPIKALVVPQKALGTDQGKKYLLVVNEQNVVDYRPVTLGPEQPGGLQVVFPMPMVRTESGLRPQEVETPGAKVDTVPSIQPSDRVIVSGLQRVHPGLAVDAQLDAKAQAALEAKQNAATNVKKPEPAKTAGPQPAKKD